MIPLRQYRKDSFFKLFLFDVGLLCAALSLQIAVLEMGNAIYKGPIIENFVQNELLSYGLHETYSWVGKTSQIEFLLETVEGIIPLEVKAGQNTKAKSLQVYKNDYRPSRTIKLVGKVGGSDKHNLVLPLYYVNQLKELLTLYT